MVPKSLLFPTTCSLLQSTALQFIGFYWPEFLLVSFSGKNVVTNPVLRLVFFFLEDSEVVWMRGRRRWKYVNVALSPKEALTSHLETVLSGAGTKRHSLFRVRALFSCFISLSVAIKFTPYFPLLKRRKKRIAKKQNSRLEFAWCWLMSVKLRPGRSCPRGLDWF